MSKKKVLSKLKANSSYDSDVSLAETDRDCFEHIHAGPDKQCRICIYGFQDIVERETKMGKTFVDILKAINKERPKMFASCKPNREHIKHHLEHSGIDIKNVKIMQQARKDLIAEKTTITELGEKAMGYLLKSLEAAGSITAEDIEGLSTKDKFAVSSQGIKDFIATQRLAMDAEKNQALKQKWLRDINKLAASGMGDNGEVQESH